MSLELGHFLLIIFRFFIANFSILFQNKVFSMLGVLVKEFTDFKNLTIENCQGQKWDRAKLE